MGERTSMKRTVRRLLWATCGVIAFAIVIERTDSYTANRKLDVFIHRVGQIREGMTEVEVRSAAGDPDKLLSDLTSPADRLFVDESCYERNGTSALLYTFEYMGWIGERLHSASSIITEVVCLDNRRIVIKTYQQITRFLNQGSFLARRVGSQD